MVLPTILKELVLDHLLHHGYQKAAQAFARDALDLSWSQVLNRLKDKAPITTTKQDDASSSGTSVAPMITNTVEEESTNDEVILRKRK
jgi:hypothetical protein